MAVADSIRVPEGAAGVYGSRGAVPLEGVQVEGRLRGACLETELRQRFRNDEDVPVEAVYVFPLPADAALCHLEVRTADGRVLGQVEEREEAFERYDEAMADGHRAFLLDQERPNIFTASVGNLQPGAAVELVLRWVMLAPWQDGALRVTVPTTVSPRYVPDREAEIGRPDGDRVNPEPWLDVPYGFGFRLEVDAGAPLRRISSPTHPVDLQLEGEGRAVVSLGSQTAAMDRDLVVLVEPEGGARALARTAVDDDGAAYAMVTVLPEAEPEHQPVEVAFVLDCSGSMGGSSIEEARRALGLCLRAMEDGDRFDIVRFGSTFESLWGRRLKYDQSRLDQALEWLEEVHADLGGTEMLAPLEKLVSSRSTAKRPLEIVLVTDGQVADEDRLLELLRGAEGDVRCFTLGIGHGPNEHLLRDLARASGAACEMIAPGERIEPAVLRTFGRLRQPRLGDVRLSWPGSTQAPARPVAFGGEPVTVLGRCDGEAPRSLAVEVGGRVLEVNASEAEDGGPVPVLWARQRIRDLEADSGRHGSAQRRPHRRSRAEAEIVELGCRFGLASSRTSWVAVQEMEDDERITEAAQLRRVPVALTEGWGGVGGFVEYARAMAPAPGRQRIADFSAPTLAAVHDASDAVAEHRVSFEDEIAMAVQPSAYNTLESPPADAGEEPLTVLLGLLAWQNADGFFEGGSEALEELEPDELAVSLAEIARRWGRPVADTLATLALLEDHFSEWASEWRAAAGKARRWLQRHGAPTSLDEALAELEGA